MTKINGSFTLDIPKTKDLSPPALDCNWEAEFEGDKEIEVALLGYYKKNYTDALKKAMGEQVKAFSVPLESMQKDIDLMRKTVEYLNNETDPVKYMAALEAFKKKYPKPLDEMVAQYNDYLKKAVANIEKQQTLAWGKKFEEEAVAAAKKAVKRDVSNKKFRHIAGVVLRGVLVLGVAAAGIAAIVLTFGTAGLVFAAIAAAGAGLGGVSALAKTGKDIYGIRDLEKRSLELLVKDVSAVTSQLGGMELKLSGISKHVTDVSTYYSKRKEKTLELEKGLQVAQEALGKMQSEAGRLGQVSDKMRKDYEAKVNKASAQVTQIDKSLEESKKLGQALETVLNDAKAAIGDLGKIPFQAAKGKLDGVTRLDFKSADTYIGLVDNLASLTGAVSSIGMAKTAK